MKKTVLLLAVVILALVTSCDKGDKKSDVGDGSVVIEQTDTEAIPDNVVAQKIIAKYNQGPAINNTDYANALEYAEAYFNLVSGHIADIQAAVASDNKVALDEADKAVFELEKQYPYNAELVQILYQASALDKKEGGLIPMNDDNRARFEALTLAYDSIGK